MQVLRIITGQKFDVSSFEDWIVFMFNHEAKGENSDPLCVCKTQNL